MWFLQNPRLVGRVTDDAHHFPLDLKPWVPADVLSGYTGMDGCTFGDKVFCLRYDLAMFVLYYNKPLMDKFGYAVPTHVGGISGPQRQGSPRIIGYYLGTWGDGWTFISYFDASGCPRTSWLMTPGIKIDMTSPRVASAPRSWLTTC
ncbi:MAG: hypothetical protein U0401_14610 [Anaerolineae bacterium]